MNSAATVDLAPDGSAWFADRIKAAEDQRAADVAEIHELRGKVEVLRSALRRSGEETRAALDQVNALRIEVERLRKSLCDSRNETQVAICEVDALKDALLARDKAVYDLKARIRGDW